MTEIYCPECGAVPPADHVFCSEVCAMLYHDEHFEEFADD